MLLKKCSLKRARAASKERGAYSLVGLLSRDSYRNPPEPDQVTRELGKRIVYKSKIATGSATCESMMWSTLHGITNILIQLGSPMQNGYIEAFNEKLRDECLNENWFKICGKPETA